MRTKVTGHISVACWTAMVVALFLGLSACHREPIYKESKKVEVHFEFDLSENDTAMHVKPRKPSLMRVIFYDPVTHKKVTSLDCSDKGGKVYGLEGGVYDMLAYNNTTEYTEIKNEDNFDNITAFTSQIPMKTDTLGVVVREPDHLLVGRLLSVWVPHHSEEDTTVVLLAKMKTVMDSYYLQIDSLQGLENISSVDVYLTNHSGYNNIGPDRRSTTASTLHLTCGVDLERKCLCTRFCTFGKLPGRVGKAILHITVTGPGGRTYDFEEDITEQYENPSHILRLVWKEIIRPKQESGFEPRVDEWDPEVIDIPIS